MREKINYRMFVKLVLVVADVFTYMGFDSDLQN